MSLTLARPVAGLALLAALAAGCSTAAAAHTTAPRPAGSATTPASATQGGHTVTATETEFHIALSQMTFTPGSYTFVAVDKGALSHNLVINGPGVAQATTPSLLSPGQSASVTVTVRKGTYDIFCGVPGHKAQGMDVHITVG